MHDVWCDVTNSGSLCKYLSESNYPLWNYHYMFIAMGYRSHMLHYITHIVPGPRVMWSWCVRACKLWGESLHLPRILHDGISPHPAFYTCTCTFNCHIINSTPVCTSSYKASTYLHFTAIMFAAVRNKYWRSTTTLITTGLCTNYRGPLK